MFFGFSYRLTTLVTGDVRNQTPDRQFKLVSVLHNSIVLSQLPIAMSYNHPKKYDMTFARSPIHSSFAPGTPECVWMCMCKLPLTRAAGKRGMNGAPPRRSYCFVTRRVEIDRSQYMSYRPSAANQGLPSFPSPPPQLSNFIDLPAYVSICT